jgi:hypothetical protein
MSVDAWASQQNRIFARINAGKRLWGTVMSEELKPCPLCGDNPYVSAQVQGYGPRVMCQNHKCSMDGSYNVDAWNTRHITLDQAKRVLAEAGMGADGWISVDDRLPEAGVYVLVYGPEEQEIAGYTEKVEDCFDVVGHDAGFISRCGVAFPGRTFGSPEYIQPAHGQPTHWQPLPPPPQNKPDA